MSKYSGTLIEDWQPSVLNDINPSGMRAIIVGGTGGLGRAIAHWLADRKADVTVIGQSFRDEGVKNISFLKADLSIMTEALCVARNIQAEQVNLLIFTTGIFSAPYREITTEGIEKDLAVSYLNRYVMLREIGPRLGMKFENTSHPARLFIMAFPCINQAGNLDDFNFENSYSQMPAHMNTVAANEALVLHSARTYPQLRVFGLNPGFAKTNIRANMYGRKDTIKFKLFEGITGLFAPIAEKYANRIGPVIISSNLDNKSGIHFNSDGKAIAPSSVMTTEHVKRIMNASDELLQQKEIKV